MENGELARSNTRAGLSHWLFGRALLELEPSRDRFGGRRNRATFLMHRSRISGGPSATSERLRWIDDRLTLARGVLEHIPAREPDPECRVVDRSDTDLEWIDTYPRGVINGRIRAQESAGPGVGWRA